MTSLVSLADFSADGMILVSSNGTAIVRYCVGFGPSIAHFCNRISSGRINDGRVQIFIPRVQSLSHSMRVLNALCNFLLTDVLIESA